ncbi:MAG: hypothetical protein O9330_07265 [Beijerinckiaceae bacterium]|jgi:hypothetical protein|nr:hypothetical protein [Beijerinckiaceae bacterium]
MSIRMRFAGPLAIAGTLLMAIPAAARTAWDAYANSNYGYCDAKKVAKVWGNSIDDAKTVIGQKILNNIQHLVDNDIASTRESVACSWSETELSYNDAVKLAKKWGGTIEAAKINATRQVSLMGNKKFRQTVASVLRR